MTFVGQLATLDEICFQVTDGKHGDCEGAEKSGFYFLSCKDIFNGKLNYDGARQITEADFVETNLRTRLEPSDILITNSGTIGRMAFMPHNEFTRRTTFQKSVAILKPNPSRVEPRFLYFLLQSDIRRLTDYAGGTAQKNLLLRDLRAFQVELPSRPMQCRIASILAAYDDLIENNTRRIVILEEMARSLYREWFVNFHFPGHENVEMVESGTGCLPAGWRWAALKEVAQVNELSIKLQHAPSHINYIDIASVSPCRVNVIQPLSFDEAPGRARRVVRHGDTIWSNVRPNRRSHALIIDPIPNLIASTGFSVLTPSTVPFSFLYLSVTTDEFTGYLANHATGAAYPAVTAKDFETATVLFPSPNVTQRFHEVAADTFVLSHRLHRKNEVLRRTRDLLLPRLISGELDVSDLDIDTRELSA